LSFGFNGNGRSPAAAAERKRLGSSSVSVFKIVTSGLAGAPRGAGGRFKYGSEHPCQQAKNAKPSFDVRKGPPEDTGARRRVTLLFWPDRLCQGPPRFVAHACAFDRRSGMKRSARVDLTTALGLRTFATFAKGTRNDRSTRAPAPGPGRRSVAAEQANVDQAE
jgi:hypothetical protein